MYVNPQYLFTYLQEEKQPQGIREQKKKKKNVGSCLWNKVCQSPILLYIFTKEEEDQHQKK